MRKIIVFLLISNFILLSCGSSNDKYSDKPQNLEELKSKYDGVDFKNCEDFINFGKEYLDVVIIAIYDIINGDEHAFEKIELIDRFMYQFDEQAVKFQEECPEKFEDFNILADEKLEKPLDELMKFMYEFDNFEIDDGYDAFEDFDEDKLD